MKTTAHHFRVFRAEVVRLMNLWAMPLWDLSIRHESIDDRHGADCWMDGPSRKASIRLNTEWGNNRVITDHGIREIARHEAIHLLLAPVTDIGERRFVSLDQWKAGEHELLELLMRILPTRKLPEGR